MFSLMRLLQKRLVEQHGIQCGFCTPGMVMSLYALLRNNASPSREDIEKALDGKVMGDVVFKLKINNGLFPEISLNLNKEEANWAQFRVDKV